MAVAKEWQFRRECLDHFLCFSLEHLDHITQTYAEFYNMHRPHQGLGNRTLTEAATGRPELRLSTSKRSQPNSLSVILGRTAPALLPRGLKDLFRPGQATPRYDRYIPSGGGMTTH